MPKKRPVPKDDYDIPIRQFAGTDVSTNPAFLDPSMLQLSQNWVPADLTFLLSKRRGTQPYQVAQNAQRIDRMLAVQSQAGHRYLVYAKFNANTGVDEVWYIEDDGPEAQVIGGSFVTAGSRVGLAWLNDAVYASVDNSLGGTPVLEIPLTDPLTATVLTPPSHLVDTGQSLAFNADADSQLPSGTVSYRWAVYNPTTKIYESIADVRTNQTPGGTNTVRADFTAPTAAPTGGRVYHLFVAPVNQEIEGAHLVTPQGLGAAGTFSLRNDAPIDGVPVPIPSTVVRAGALLGSHLGRLIVAGDSQDPRAFYCTDVLQQGLEQAIFNQGTFFPANGRYHATATITGFAVGTIATMPENPDSPLLVFTATSTTGFFGDLLDDPNLRIRTLSKRIGCVAHGSIAYTNLGPIWVGQQSVYLFAPSGMEPIDVGWPIWPIIRAIPQALRPFLEGTFHKGFYKLALCVPGNAKLTQQWWLDCRRGVGDVSGAFASTPAWFGPMVGLTVSTFAQSFFDPAEDDRGFAAVDDGSGTILLTDQVGSFADNGTTFQSIGRTARLDDGAPFLRKHVTRVRAIANVAGQTSLKIAVSAIGQTERTQGMPVPQPSVATATGVMSLQSVLGSDFETGNFETGDFTGPGDIEGQFIPAPARPRGQAIEVTFSHGEAVAIALRDLDVAYQPLRGVA